MIAGTDPDYAIRDLYEAIAQGDYVRHAHVLYLLHDQSVLCMYMYIDVHTCSNAECMYTCICVFVHCV